MCGWNARSKMSLDDLTDPLIRARLALALLRLDPQGLGGMTLRARSGPTRDAVLALVPTLPTPQRRLHPGTTDEALFGGLDLQSTLSKGRMVMTKGLLADSGSIVLTMAERTTPALAGRLCATLDAPGAPVLIALDEGADIEEAVPMAVSDRLAFHISLDGVRCDDRLEPIEAAPSPQNVTYPDQLPHDLVTLCDSLGIAGARAPLFALHAACAHAGLYGRDTVERLDVEAAIALTLAHRATRMPAQDEAPAPEQPPAPADRDEGDGGDNTLDLPQEMLLEAARALIPDDLLARLATARTRAAKGSGTGARTASRQRGRPIPSRQGRPGGDKRIDLLATLRAAAPWQTIRARARPDHSGLHVRPSDIHLRRFEDHADRLLIFTVDASGSAALARLAEAKGAVEIMLAQAYARRDHVALVSFRGEGAELLLPPTRSLVQTKRRLAQLPGGGGTPLAAGLRQAMELSALARRRGITPTIALLTNGRANIALDGSRDRTLAGEDAKSHARHIAAQGIETITIDTGRRPEPALRDLSNLMGGTYLPMPRADAQRLADTARAALDA